MNPETISTDLKKTLRRLKLSRMLDTLPERLTLARQQKMPHQDFLLMALGDEATRRDTQAASMRAHKAQLDPTYQLENWDETANVSFNQELLNELASLRFVESNLNVDIVGPVGVGKTFLAHALGHIACRRGHSVLAVQADRMLKTLKQARLLDTYEAELRKLVCVDLLVVDDFALDAMDAQQSRDVYDIFSERQNHQGQRLRRIVRRTGGGRNRERDAYSTHQRGSWISGRSNSVHAKSSPHSVHLPRSGHVSCHDSTTPRWS